MNITEFLEARITDDEVDAARELADMERSAVSIQYDCDTQARFTPARVLAECAAKRAIIAECRPGTLSDLDSGEDDQPAPMWVARALAAVYKDHPDYQQEWAL